MDCSLLILNFGTKMIQNEREQNHSQTSTYPVSLGVVGSEFTRYKQNVPKFFIYACMQLNVLKCTTTIGSTWLSMYYFHKRVVTSCRVKPHCKFESKSLRYTGIIALYLEGKTSQALCSYVAFLSLPVDQYKLNTYP